MNYVSLKSNYWFIFILIINKFPSVYNLHLVRDVFRIKSTLLAYWGFPDAQAVKNPPRMQETQEMWVPSLSPEDLLEEEIATYSSIPVGKIPWTEEPGEMQSKWSQRLEQSYSGLSDFIFTFHFHALEKEMATNSSILAWRFQGQRSLVGWRLWGHTESDTTEVT